MIVVCYGLALPVCGKRGSFALTLEERRVTCPDCLGIRQAVRA